MLIGLTGYAGSGKNTAADYLTRAHSFREVAFADKLRELAYAQSRAVFHDGQIIGTVQQLVARYGWDRAKREFPHVRVILQETGQAHREVFGADFWINQVLPARGTVVGNLFASVENVVVTDVRYLNEAYRVQDLGGLVIRVDRDGVGPVNDHPSESVLPADYTVHNPEGAPEVMYRQLDRIIKENA